MPRFFVEPDKIQDNSVIIYGDDARHISRSLRMAVGENITVCDTCGIEYLCELDGFFEDRVTARILSQKPSETEPLFTAHIYQALPKGEKLDYIIQKAVECGASSITTFSSERCIAKEKQDENKLKRRQRIALEAAKQSGRGIVPTVRSGLSFQQTLSEIKKYDVALFCYEDERAVSLRGLLKTLREENRLSERPNIALVIGSEGGFSEKEAEMAREAGAYTVGLGKRILRSETASGFALACLVYEFEL